MGNSINPTQITMYASLNLSEGNETGYPSASLVPMTSSYQSNVAPHFDLVDGRTNPQLELGLAGGNVDPKIRCNLLDYPASGSGVNAIIIDNHNLENSFQPGDDAKDMRVQILYDVSSEYHLNEAYGGNLSGSLTQHTITSNKVNIEQNGILVMNATGSGGMIKTDWELVFDRSSGDTYTNNGLIGEVALCHRFTTPFNPDQNSWAESIKYDGITKNEAIGGNIFTTELHKERRVFTMIWSRLLLSQRHLFEDFFQLIGGEKHAFWISFNSDSSTPKFYRVRLISNTVRFRERTPRTYELNFAVMEDLG